MNALLKDPVVLICSAIVFVGIIAFFWAIGKFRRLGSVAAEASTTDDLFPRAPELPDIDFRAPAPVAREPQAYFPAASAPAAAGLGVSKDVADRLENMTQRLSEMQTVLMKQSAAAAAAPAGGGSAATGNVGQGFTPETIDKLLKIIGNVIQQVDILQKNLNVTK